MLLFKKLIVCNIVLFYHIPAVETILSDCRLWDFCDIIKNNEGAESVAGTVKHKKACWGICRDQLRKIRPTRRNCHAGYCYHWGNFS